MLCLGWLHLKTWICFVGDFQKKHSTMVTHNEQPPFGIVFLEVVPSASSQQIQIDLKGFVQKQNIHFLIQGPLFRNVVLGSCFVSIGLWMQCIYGHGCFSGQFSRGLSPFIPPSWRIPGLDYTCRKSNMTGWQIPPWMNRCMDPIEDGGFSSQSC